MVFDLFMFNGEYDVLDLRLHILDPYVDFFVIGEAEVTFSSKAKPLYFELQKERYKKFWPKIRYNVVKNFYNSQIISSMHTFFPEIQDVGYPFLMAFYQKEYLQAALADAKDDDQIYYGDCDEIWTPQQAQEEPIKFKQLSYAMYLDRRSSEYWAGTTLSTFAKVKQYGLSQIRQKAPHVIENGGWHFTNMGGLEEIRRKLEFYDHQEVNTPINQELMEERHRHGMDFLGRDYKNFTDESQWPQFLKDNKEKYKHLLWPQ